jgi:hypothetical protein
MLQEHFKDARMKEDVAILNRARESSLILK